MARAPGILRQDSRNRRASPLDRGISVNDDPQAESVNRLLRRVGEEQQPEATALIETLRQISRSVTNEELAKLVNNYLRSRRSRILSYENFFRALNDFRHKIWNGSSLGWRSRVENEECSPEDYETFDALVELIGKIAEYDESSRIHIADNPDWNHPLHIFATLVSCAIPTTMKATILLTLASFARSTGPATLIWQYMGAVLAPLTVTGPKQGLKLELEEMEVRYREFPVTKAIILLMSRIFVNLSDHALAPDFLQQFQEFIAYVNEAVFSKVDERSFASPQEHLDVLLSCLQLFEKCLKSLNELSFMFVPALTVHPGYVLRQKILEGHGFFDKLFNWLTVCAEEHSKSHSDGVHRRLEDVICCILQIFCAVIHHHDDFLTFLKQHDHNASAMGFETLVANTINIRSAKKDFIFTFLKLLNFYSKRLDIAQLSLEIVNFVTCRVEDHKDWISVLYYDEKLYKTVVATFADCIVIDPESTQQENKRLETAESNRLVQDALKMLLGNQKQCLHPSLAHVLLGFPVRNGTVQASALGAEISQSALPRILELIEPGKVLFELIPTITETALDILDCLCQKQSTGTYVLRYLRNDWSGDLSVDKLVAQLPLVNNDDAETHGLLRHQKAILHIAAKEIRVLMEEYMIPSANNLISRLCGFVTAAENTVSFPQAESPSGQQGSGSLLYRLFSVAKLSLPSLISVRSLNFEFLDYANVEDALNSARVATDDGQVLHDASLTLMYLRELLHGYEENGMSRADMVHDFKTLCDFIEQETLQVGLVRARKECFEAWNILVCVIAESLNAESFPFPVVPTFLIQLCAVLTKEIGTGMAVAETSTSYETVFTLLSAFMRFSGPIRHAMNQSDALNVEGFAMKALIMDYKSISLRSSGTFISETVTNLVSLVLRQAATTVERQYCYANLCVLLKWADWDYANCEDNGVGYFQSVQNSASAIRSHVRNAFSLRLEDFLKTLLDDAVSVNGPREAVVIQTLSSLWKLMELDGYFLSYRNFSILSRIMATLAKDNQKLAQCIASQTDTDNVLGSFETKMSALTTWTASPQTRATDQQESAPYRTAIQTVLLFDVMRALNVIKDARNTLNPVQRAWMAGTSSSVYGYCIRIFRKIVDFLIAVVHQVRLRPAFRDLLAKVSQYIETYGVVLSDFLREPSDTDDPAWDDIDRTVELISLVGHQYFLRKLADPTCTEIPMELVAIELKLGRLLQNLNTILLPAPSGNYKGYYAALRRRSRSVRLVSNLLKYLRQTVFKDNTVNVSAVRPVFARSNMFGRKELAMGTISLSYGDLLAHIRTFCQAVLDRIRNYEDIRTVAERSGSTISESDLKLVLDSDLVPARREDRENFYRLFIKEQEYDVIGETRQLLNVVECLVMILVTHLEHVFSLFMADAEQVPLPVSLRRVLLPALEQEMSTTPYDEYRHFKSNVREFFIEEFVASLAELHKAVGNENNRFLGVYLGRLMDVIELAGT